MATFTLGRFSDAGEVYFESWHSPRKGETVRLSRTPRGIAVCKASAESGYEVRYTWPGGDNQQASRKAIKHYEKMTGLEVC
jgi:hypothetical protein